MRYSDRIGVLVLIQRRPGSMGSPPLETEASDPGTDQGPPDERIGTRLADGGAEQTAADDAQVVDDRCQRRVEESPLDVLGRHEQRSRPRRRPGPGGRSW